MILLRHVVAYVIYEDVSVTCYFISHASSCNSVTCLVPDGKYIHGSQPRFSGLYVSMAEFPAAS